MSPPPASKPSPANISIAAQEAGQSLSPHRSRQGQGQFRHRSLDGRNRPAANARSNCSSSSRPSPAKKSPCKPSPRNSPADSTRASITSATSISSKKNSTTIWPSSPTPIKEFGLPADLKLSVHSGSDKFSIYPAIRRAIQKTGAGLHIKTAGTTWLEELIGLASPAAKACRSPRMSTHRRWPTSTNFAAPTPPSSTSTNPSCPQPEKVSTWTGEQYAEALRHDQNNPRLQPALPPTPARRLQSRRPAWASATPKPWRQTKPSSPPT